MKLLYSENDYKTTVAMLRRIWIIILIIAAICIAAWAVTASQQDKELRIAWPGYVAAGVCTFAIVFIYGLFGARVNAYRKFLRDIYQGLEREMTGIITDIEGTPSVSNNLEFTVIHMAAELDMGKESDCDRILHYDPVKAPIPFEAGQRVRLLLFGNNIKGYEILPQ